MPSFFTSDSSWIVLILILVGYELYDSNRKFREIQKTLAKILAQLSNHR